jgi:hypothetical protein
MHAAAYDDLVRTPFETTVLQPPGASLALERRPRGRTAVAVLIQHKNRKALFQKMINPVLVATNETAGMHEVEYDRRFR